MRERKVISSCTMFQSGQPRGKARHHVPPAHAYKSQ